DVHGPDLILAKVGFEDFVVGVFFLALLFAFAFDGGCGKGDLLRIVGPVEAANIGWMARQLPGFAAGRSDEPDLLGGGFFVRIVVLLLILVVFLFFRLLLVSFLFFGKDRGRFAFGDESEPAAVRRPLHGAGGLFAARELKRFAGRSVDQPDLPDVGVFLPVGFAHAIGDELAVGRNLLSGEALEDERLGQGRRVLTLRLQAMGIAEQGKDGDDKGELLQGAPPGRRNSIRRSPKRLVSARPGGVFRYLRSEMRARTIVNRSDGS